MKHHRSLSVHRYTVVRLDGWKVLFCDVFYFDNIISFIVTVDVDFQDACYALRVYYATLGSILFVLQFLLFVFVIYPESLEMPCRGKGSPA